MPIFNDFSPSETASLLLDPEASRKTLDQVNQNFSTQGLDDTLLSINMRNAAEENDRQAKLYAENLLSSGKAKYFPGSGAYIDTATGKQLYKDHLFLDQFKEAEENYRKAKELGFNREQHRAADEILAASERIANIEGQQKILRDRGLNLQADSLEDERQKLMGENSRRAGSLGNKINLLKPYSLSKKSFWNRLVSETGIDKTIESLLDRRLKDENLGKSMNLNPGDSVTRLNPAELSNEKRGFWENFREMFTDSENIPIVGGAFGFAENIGVTQAAKRAELGIDYYRAELKRQKPDAPEQQIETWAQNAYHNDLNTVNAFLNDEQEKALRGNSFMGGVGEITAKSLPFMADFALTGGTVGAIAKGAAKAAGKSAAKAAGKNTAKGLMKFHPGNFGKAAKNAFKDFAKTTAATSPLIATQGLASGAQRIANATVGEDEQGNPTFNRNVNIGAEMSSGIADTGIEVVSEATGGLFRLALPVKASRKVVQGYRKLMSKLPAQRLVRTLNRTKAWNGTVGEIAEEYVGDILRGVAGIDSNGTLAERIEQTLPSTQEFMQMAVSFGITPAILRAPGFAATLAKFRKDTARDLKRVLNSTEAKKIQQDAAADSQGKENLMDGMKPLKNLEPFPDSSDPSDKKVSPEEQAKNVIGVNGGNSVQSIPVKDLQIDPQRFQFKSRADKVSGVDESNKIGGTWDPKTAGNLYVWEDKNGKKIVVNGHHRFDLARKNNVENVNAIIDREADGVTADQARRNGILINIRDEQGDVRDYAEFVRRENMDENTAEKEGILARAKGRQGYTIGRYAGNTLYSAYRNGEIPDGKAAEIANIARGDEAIEAVGIKEKELNTDELRQLLNALKTLERPKTEQGDLFGFDESALELEKSLSKQAAKHLREIRETVNAARDAIKNPAAARKLGVNVGKDAEKLLKKALREQAEWDKWYLAGSGKREILMEELGLKKEVPENIQQGNRMEGAGNSLGGSSEVFQQRTIEHPAGDSGRTENGPDEQSAETVKLEAATSSDDNIYFRMPLDRVRKDAELGVLKAKEALKILEGNTETAGKDSASTTEPETQKTPREEKEETRLKHLLRERYNGAEVEFVDPQDDSQRAVAEFLRKELGKNVRFFKGTLRADGFHHKGKLYLNTKNEKPLMAAAFHEYTHDLRENDPDSYNNLMKNVMRLASEEQLAEWKKNYNRRYSSRNYIELDDAALEEEFIADVAGSVGGTESFLRKIGEQSPNLLERFLAWLKQLKDALYKDGEFDQEIRAVIGNSIDEIETLFARKVVEKRSENAETRVSNPPENRKNVILDALRKIVEGSEEETIPNLRNDLEQYGGTNNITLIWGNEKKGIFHIGYRRGTDTLLHVIDALANGKIERYVAGNKTVHLVKDGYEAILSLDENGNKKSWLLTGWEINKPDAFGQFSTKSEATQNAPTFSRRDLGAGLRQSWMNDIPSDSKIALENEKSSSDSQFLRDHVIVGEIPKTGVQDKGGQNDESRKSSGGQVRNGSADSSGGLRKGNSAVSDSDRRNIDPSSEKGGKGMESAAKSESAGSSTGRAGGNRDGLRDEERGLRSERELVDRTGSSVRQPVVEKDVSGRTESDGTSGEAGKSEGGRGVPEGLRSGGTGNTAETSGEVRKTQSLTNHRIRETDELISGGDTAKTNANLQAIRLLKQLENENRDATDAEKKVLARYVGWGGLPSVFEYGNKYYDELKKLLTEEEFAAARASTINAHYTDRCVIRNMWGLAERLGFQGGKVGEFGAGVGHFLGLIPDSLYEKTKFRAVELDSISGRILKKLYPLADVTIRGLQDTKVKNNSLDMVIGNFPFAKDGPYDRNYPRFSLHNYFFARAIDAVKPGGLVVAVTSTGTLDSNSSLAAREFFSGKADLVGAIRLPEDAFKKNAGTSVVTDIVILRKKDGTDFQGESFLYTQETDTSDGTGKVHVNEYFVRHPEMMLGELSNTGSMYRGNSQTLLANGKLEEQLPDAINRLRSNIYGAQKSAEEIDDSSMDEERKEFEIFEKNGKLFQTVDGNTEELTQNGKPLSERETEKVKSFLRLKRAFDSVIHEMLESDGETEKLKHARKMMNTAYEAHLKNFGNISDTRKHRILKDDPNYLRISGLENKKEIAENGKKKTVYSKSDIFTKRTLFRVNTPQSAENVTDAARISVNMRGSVQPAYIAELTGMTEEEARAELLASGNFFENPENGAIESAGRYLSGNIAEKIRIAKENGMLRNVEALEKVFPPRKEIGSIGFQLGSSWMPEKVVSAWANDIFGVETKIKYNKAADRWIVTCWRRNDIAKFRGSNFDAIDVLEKALNLQNHIVYQKVGDKNLVDNEASLAARQVREEMMQSFKDYVNTHSESAKAVEEEFNSKMNVYREREYELPEMDFYPNAAHYVDGKEFKLREHQKRLVSRCLEGNTLIAHCVGAGKTYEMITAAMELKRLKLAHKNLIVVQNSTLEQFAASIMKLYPTARVLTASKNDLEGAKRKRFMSRTATGDWDIVVMAQSSFDQIPDKPEFEQAQNLKAIEDYEQIIADLKAERSYENRRIIKDIERQKKRIEERNKALADRKKDDVIYFDELGFDSIFIDEAHAYKKNGFVTKMPNVKGLDKGSSKRAYSLFLKIQQTMQKTGGRNIFFATGTPITNTLTEIWNMVRYLSTKTLEDFGVETFDRFASLFTQTVQGMEIDAAGRFRIVERFAQYNNIEELGKMFGSVADIILPEELKGVPRPPVKGGGAQLIHIKRSESMKKFMNYLLDLYSWYEGLPKDEKIKNPVPLIVHTLAKKASIDLRLVDENLPDDPGSKLNRAAEEIAKKYKEYEKLKGAQAVFFDLYQTPGGKFNAYEELKQKLVKRGIPAEKIAIATELKTDKQKEETFAKVNRGEIRVIMGSTERLGIGVNMQERLACLHHLDAPARPADMEQRNGRIIRQGNTISPVEILNYAVEETLDAGLYQTLARKDKFIKSVMRGRGGTSLEAEESEDSMDYASFAAMISGNPKAMRKVEVDAEVKKLNALKDQSNRNIRQLQNDNIVQYRNLDFYKNAIKKVEEFIRIYGDVSFKENISLEYLGNRVNADRKKIAELLDHQIKRALNERDGHQFTLKLNGIGLKFHVREKDLYKNLGYELEENLGPTSIRQGSPDIGTGTGLLNSLTSLIASKEEELDHLKKEIPLIQARINNNDQEIAKGFPYQEKLKKAIAEQAELIRELKTDEKSTRRISKKPSLRDYIKGAEFEADADIYVEEKETDDVKLSAHEEESRIEEAAERLKKETVAQVPANAIKAGNGMTAIEAAMDYVRKNLTGTFDTEIGPVDVDANAIKQSLTHSLYQNKLDATQAIGDVLTKGAYLGNAPDKDGKPIENHYFVAKVKIGNADKIVFVRTRQAQGRKNRFYVHEVFTEDEIKKLGNQQTAPRLSAMAHRNASEFYRTIIARVMNVKESSEKSGTGPESYAIDGEIREAAKQRIRELFHEKNVSQNEIIPFGRFSPAVVDALKEFIPEIDNTAQMAMRGSEFNHIRNRHPEINEMQFTSIVDLMDHPESVAFEIDHGRKVIWFVDQNKRMFSISYYGKRNIGWIKTLYGTETLEKKMKRRGVQLMSVANSDLRQDSAVSGANPTLLEINSSPLDHSIAHQEDIVKREKEESDNISLSIQPEEIQKHAEKSMSEALKEVISLKDRRARKDISKFSKMFGTIQFYSEKVPALKRIFQLGMELEDNKNLLEHSLYHDGVQDDLKTFSDFSRRNTAEYKKLAGYIRECDKNEIGYRVGKQDNTYRILDRDGNDTQLRFMDENTAWNKAFRLEAEELVKAGYSSEAAGALLAFRSILSRVYEMLKGKADALKRDADEAGIEIPKIDGVDLFEELRKMGDRRGYYMPRIRHGRYMLWAHKNGENPRLEIFDTPAGRKLRALQLIRNGWKVTQEITSTPSEEAFAGANIASLNDLLQSGITDLEKGKVHLEDVGMTGEYQDYHRKDGKIERHYVVMGSAGREFARDLKSLGGRFYGGAWHFANAEEGMEEVLCKTIAMDSVQKGLVTAFGRDMAERIAVLIHSHGSRSRKISRDGRKGADVYLGYEEDPLTALRLVCSGTAAGTAKTEFAKNALRAVTGTEIPFDEYAAEHGKKNIELFSEEWIEERTRLRREYMKYVNEQRIDSATQPEAYSESLAFIREMMRNTEASERVMGKIRAIAAVKYLSRISTGLINLTSLLTSTPAMMHAHGGIPIPKAWRELSLAVPKAANYMLYAKLGVGKKLNDEDMNVFEKMAERGWIVSLVNKEAASVGLTFAGRTWRTGAAILLGGQEITERINRAASIYAAYKVLCEDHKGKLDEKLKDEYLEKAKYISDRANGVYGKVNLPTWARGASLGAQMARAWYMFKTYPHTYIQALLECGFRKKDILATAYMTFSPMAVAGLSASPLFVLAPVMGPVASWILRKVCEALGTEPPDDPDEWIYKWLEEKAGVTAARSYRHGLFGAAGVNITGSLSMNDFSLPTTLEDVGGASYSVLSDVFYGTGDILNGDVWKGAERLVPSALSSTMRGIREMREGVTDRRNNPVYWEGEPLTGGWGELLLRSFGFNPVSISEKTERLWRETQTKREYTEARNRIYNRVRRYYLRRIEDPDEALVIQKEIEHYNARVRRNRPHGISLITRRSLDAVKQRQFNPEK